MFVKNYDEIIATIKNYDAFKGEILLNGKVDYNFKNSSMITSFSNNPQYSEMKNDFIVWGIRKNANGNDRRNCHE